MVVAAEGKVPSIVHTERHIPPVDPQCSQRHLLFLTVTYCTRHEQTDINQGHFG